MTASAVVKFDGGARPPDNGPAAIGYTVEVDGLTEEKEHNRIGRATCNEAEYHALIRGWRLPRSKDTPRLKREVTRNWS